MTDPVDITNKTVGLSAYVPKAERLAADLTDIVGRTGFTTTSLAKVTAALIAAYEEGKSFVETEAQIAADVTAEANARAEAFGVKQHTEALKAAKGKK